MTILSKFRGSKDPSKPYKLNNLIFLTLFLTFFLIKLIWFIPAYYEEEIDELQALESSAKEFLKASLHPLPQISNPKIRSSRLKEAMAEIMQNPLIKGINLDSTQDEFNLQAGEKPGYPINQLPALNRLFLQQKMLKENRYDVAFDAQDLDIPMDVSARLDSSKVAFELHQTFKRGVVNSLLEALILALITMILLHSLLLRDLLKLKAKLSLALQDFDHPDRYLLPQKRADELGTIFDQFNELLRRIAGIQKTMKAHEAIQMMGIDERNKIFSQITHYNAITGLPNRALLIIKLKDYIRQAAEEKKRAVLLIIDIREFHEIANSLGQETANLFQKQIAKLLSESAPKDGIAAHIKTTRFAIARNNIESPGQIMNLAQWLIELFKQPFSIGSQNILTPINIGISVWPEDGEKPEDLINNANLALDRARASGPNTYEFHEDSMNEAVTQKRALLLDMHYALERQEFMLHYQPQMDIQQDRVIGVEALIRWNHPKKGLISPSTFIPLAEESELIINIGEWALNEACTQALKWLQEGLDLIVAVNLSTIQFKQKDIVEMVNAALTKTQLPPKNLEIEITESGIMSNLETAIYTMRSLKGLGVRLSIDDFGTGYSSLSYLKRFPVQKLKIDQSFVKEIGKQDSTHNGSSLVPIIITLGHALGLKVIAEGVETKAQLNSLRSMGCDEAQGYYYSKPIPASQCEVLFQKLGLKKEGS